MKSNAPAKYTCPICLGIKGVENTETLIRASDKIFDDGVVTGLINSFFVGKNAGHVIVVPNTHYETIYDLPSEIGHHLFDRAKQVATIMKQEYECDGITIRQNNEPAGDQHAFHYHMHIFPRYDGDGFNEVRPDQKRLADEQERAGFAARLHHYFAQ